MNPLLIGLVAAGLYFYSTSKKSIPKSKSNNIINFPGYKITNCNNIEFENSDEVVDYAFNVGKNFTDINSLKKDLFGTCKDKLQINSQNILYVYILYLYAYAGAYTNKKLEITDAKQLLINFTNKYKNLGTNKYTPEQDIVNITEIPEKPKTNPIPKEVDEPKSKTKVEIQEFPVLETNFSKGITSVANYVLYSGNGNKNIPLIVGFPNTPGIHTGYYGYTKEDYFKYSIEMLKTLSDIADNKANIIVFPYIQDVTLNTYDKYSTFKARITTALSKTIGYYLNKFNSSEIIIIGVGVGGTESAIKLALHNYSDKTWIFNSRMYDGIDDDLYFASKNESILRMVDEYKDSFTRLSMLKTKIPNTKFYYGGKIKANNEFDKINALLNGLIYTKYPWWS